MKTGAALLVAVAIFAAGCGSKSGSSDNSSNAEMVWCVAPGEVVDAQFKREYPELYMDKAACDAVNSEAP